MFNEIFQQVAVVTGDLDDETISSQLAIRDQIFGDFGRMLQ